LERRRRRGNHTLTPYQHTLSAHIFDTMYTVYTMDGVSGWRAWVARGIRFCDLVGSRTHKPYMLSLIGIGISVVLLETGMDFSIGDWVVLLMFERKTSDYIYLGVIGYCL